MSAQSLPSTATRVGLRQGIGGLPLEGILPRLTVAGLSCAVLWHSGLLNVYTHT